MNKFRVSSVLWVFFSVHPLLPVSIVIPQSLVKLTTTGIPRDATQRLSSYPYITGDTFRAFCDFVIDETCIPFDPAQVYTGATIFLNGNHLDFFFKKVHPVIKARYILITHNSRHSAPGAYAHFLDDPKIIAWFAKNTDIVSHPKLISIPLGIANSYWPHGNVQVFNDIRSLLPSITKDKLIYVNFNVATNFDGNERLEAYAYFKDQPFCTYSAQKPFEEYIRELAEHRFVISPEGAGIDCHRTWEALLVGTIPIVKHSTIDHVFDGLPVVLINHWSEVTPEFLEAKYAELSTKQFNTKKLWADYWFTLIRHYQGRAAGSHIPLHFPLDFHDAMAPSALYNYKKELTQFKVEWVVVKFLYDAFIKYGLDYAPQPRIPKIIHQIWLGSELPEKYKKFQESWRVQHPDWEYKLWTERDIQAFGLTNKKLFDAACNYGEKSDIARYEILYRMGGLYVDTDFECLRPFDVFHHTCNFYAGLTYGKEVTLFNGLIGCSPGHPILKACIETMQRNAESQDDAISILFRTGPYHLTRCFKSNFTQGGRNIAFPVIYFYPWPNYNRDENKPEQIQSWIKPASFAVHHWESAWNNYKPPHRSGHIAK